MSRNTQQIIKMFLVARPFGSSSTTESEMEEENLDTSTSNANESVTSISVVTPSYNEVLTIPVSSTTSVMWTDDRDLVTSNATRLIFATMSRLTMEQ